MCANDVLMNESIQLLQHVIVTEVTLDNRATFQVGTELGGHPLHDCLRWHSQIFGHIIDVKNIRLNTIET